MTPEEARDYVQSIGPDLRQSWHSVRKLSKADALVVQSTFVSRFVCDEYADDFLAAFAAESKVPLTWFHHAEPVTVYQRLIEADDDYELDLRTYLEFRGRSYAFTMAGSNCETVRLFVRQGPGLAYCSNSGLGWFLSADHQTYRLTPTANRSSRG